MPLQIPEDELQAILAVVAAAGSGASVGDLMADEGLRLKRRTLQRRLDLLSRQGRLVSRGEGRGRRYLMPQDEIGFNRYTLCNLDALLSDNLLSDPAACGRLRARPVGISGTVFHPLEVPQQIEECFHFILTKATEIEDPFEAAFFVMVQLPYLQAFEDVNKRVSRLAANIPLIRHNLCPLSFVDVEAEDYLNGLIGIYELNRIELLRDVFVWAYTRSSQRYTAARQSLGDPDPFRLKYRSQIGSFVREIVQHPLTRDAAGPWIRQTAAKNIPEADRAQFIETIEVELESLHEGNIARYRLRAREFAKWKSDQPK